MKFTKKRIMTGAVAMLSLVALCFSMVACTPSTTNEQSGENNNPANETILAGGMQVSEIGDYGIQLLSTPIEVCDFEEYGVSAYAENAITVNATIEPSDAAIQGVDWSVAWTNPSATWAVGKDVSSYVSIATGNATKTVTVSCLQPFGEQITLTAKSQDNPNITAKCTLDYAQKVTAASLNIGDISVNIGGTTKVKYEVASGITGQGGTISANITTNDVYTIAETYTKTVKFSACGENLLFKLKDKTISSLVVYDSSVTNWLGKEYYFDYDHDICKWMIFQRSGDILFKNLSTGEIVEYFKDITVPNLAIVTLTLEGKHNTYTYSSTLVCEGYTNNKPVSNISVDTSQYVF